MTALLTLLLGSLALAAPADGAPVEDPAAAEEPLRLTRIDASLTLRVDDQQAALDEAVAAARSRGGWFSSLSESAVTLRVPAEDMEPLIEELRGKGEVVERSFSTQDLSSQRDEVATRLASRRQLLERYREVLATAHADAVVNVEREISRAITQIEELQGTLRVLDDRGQYGQLSVGFQYRDRRAPSRDGTSSFAWLNSVNMADLLQDFESGERASRSVLSAEAPEGFAPYRRTCRFQAVSPDDVVFRVRSVKNKPKADVAFWQEALRTRMVEAGYHLEAETALTTAGGQAGTLLELGAANGAQDQAYVLGLFVSGGRIVLVEASGEAEAFAARREAVVAAIEGLGD